MRHHLSGAAFTLGDFQGHVILLNFWATWCEPCMVEIPDLAKVASQYGNQVSFVAVYYQPEAQVEPQVTSWLRSQPDYFAHQVAWGNSALHALFPHPHLPTTYVVGRGGVVVTKFVGSITGEARVAELRAAIESGLMQPLPSLPHH